MDWLTFISNAIRDLAWPIIALAVLGAFLFQGRAFVRLVKTFRYKDFELTTREEFFEARADAEQVKLTLDDQPSSSLNPKDRILQLAEIDPGLAIIDIWKTLDAELLKLIQHNGLVRFTTPDKFVAELGKLGKLSSREESLYRKLRQIRNASVHAHGSFTLTLAEVIEFRDFVDVLVKRFEQMKNEPGYIDIPPPESQA